MRNQTSDNMMVHEWRASVLECGGQRSATPLSPAGWLLDRSQPSSTRKRRRRVALPAQSKTWWQFVALLGFIVLHSAFCLRASGQSYSIDWFTIDGGFWGIIAVVQTPGAPLLTITYSGNQAIVSWPSSVTSWALQTNRNLATGAWGNYAGSVINNTVTNSPTPGNLFFRLKQP